MIAGGVESMSRAPFVLPKAESAFSRHAEIHDTTIGWRFVNPLMKAQYGVDSMPETGENVAEDYKVCREDQDDFAVRSPGQGCRCANEWTLGEEITPVTIPQRKGDPVVVEHDEHPRETTIETLAKLPTPFRKGGTVTAGNATGVNDGAAALIIASEAAAKKYGLTPHRPRAGRRYCRRATTDHGHRPGAGLAATDGAAWLEAADFDVIELNEAFASQGLATLRDLGIADDDQRVNPNGGAIALGHPLGMSGARITGTAALELAPRRRQAFAVDHVRRRGPRYRAGAGAGLTYRRNNRASRRGV